MRRGEADGDERVNEEDWVVGYVCAVVCPEEQSPHGLSICGGACRWVSCGKALQSQINTQTVDVTTWLAPSYTTRACTLRLPEWTECG